MVNVYSETTLREFGTDKIIGYEPVTMIQDPSDATKTISSYVPGGKSVTQLPGGGYSAPSLILTPTQAQANIGYKDNPNSPVQIDRLKNTSNIDPQFNQPKTVVGKVWAFGNPEFEGAYKPVANLNAELQGVKHDGTLYKSDTGRWQIIDKRGQLVMSGSEGADLPKITDYDKSPWISINSSPQQGRISGMESPKVIAGGTGAPSVTYEAPQKSSANPDDYSLFNKKGSFDPTFSDYRIDIETQSGGVIPSAPKKLTASEIKKLEDEYASLYGTFGAPSKPKRHQLQRKPVQKPVGFMDIFGNAKKVMKRQAPNIQSGSGLSYETLFAASKKPAKPIKSPVKKPLKAPVKKPIAKKKEIGFDNAYEVLFSTRRRK